MSHYVFHSALERHAERAIEENNKAVLRTLLYLNTNISEEDDNYERDNIERLLKEHPEAVYAETLEWYSTEIKK